MTTKPNTATIYRKRQVLTAKQLTKSLGEYGTQGGAVPYNDDSQQDTSFALPLGTKAAPFGNAFFKGFNLYTTVEVQALVTAGKLTATDRMVFWNLDTNTLNAWNGSEIVSVAGGNNSMDYLFGDGSDGDVTMVANGSYDRMKNFENFTLNSGITLSKTTAGSPLIIRCTGTCTINGTIDLSGKGFSGTTGIGYGYGSASGYDDTLSGVGQTNRFAGGAFDANAAEIALAALNFDQIPFCGGGGGGGYMEATSSASYSGDTVSQIGGIGAGAGGRSCVFRRNLTQSYTATGGNGGGGLLIIARKIIIAGSIVLTGTQGSYGHNHGGSNTNYYQYDTYGGGGGGGCGAFVGNDISITGTINCAGGAAGGSYTGATSATAGGAGGYIKLVI